MNTICEDSLSNILRELEETMDKANLLALELALKGLEDGDLQGTLPEKIDGIGHFTRCAAEATEEIERLVRQIKAA